MDVAAKPAGERDVAIEAVKGQKHRQAGARRTAWILAAIAIGFFIASLVQGHLAHIPH